MCWVHFNTMLLKEACPFCNLLLNFYDFRTFENLTTRDPASRLTGFVTLALSPCAVRIV